MPYLDESGLAYYSEKLQPWIASQPVKTIPSSLYPWTQTDKAGAVPCWPVGGTPLLPTVDFLFTETPPASGDKGPENPSTITGVSDVMVTHGNKNYVSLPYHTPSSTRADVAWTIDSDGSVVATGTASATSNFYLGGIGTTSLRLVPNKKYFLHGCPSGGSASTFRLGVTCGANSTYSNAYDYGSGAVFIPKTHDSDVTVFAQVFTGYSANLTFKPQLEDGETGTVFEVVPRAVYTLPLGSTYYGGSIDLATGVMTVTWERDVCTSFASVDVISTNTISFRYNASAYHPATGVLNNQMACNRFPVINNSDDVEHCRFSGAGITNTSRFYINKTRLDISGAVDPSNPTNAEWVAAANVWLASHPTFLVYILATPYTVQLDPTEILSLAQTDKYTPRLNTVYTDASAVQVGYVKSPIREEYELTQAIVAQGGSI